MYALDEIAADAATFRAAVQTGVAYRPLYVKFKVVWGCNLRCRGCKHWRDARPGTLAQANWQAIIDELASLGCRKIHLSGGEPTLRADLENLIARIAAHGMRPTLTTNATLISRDRARTLAAAGLKGVNVSLDSPDPRVHDRIRGVDGAWKHTIKGATYLRRRLKHGHLRINAVISRLNYSSLTALPDLAADLGADYLNLIPLDEHTGDLRRLNKAQILDYNRRIAPYIAERSLALGLMRCADQAYPFGSTPAEIEITKAGDYARGRYGTHPCYAPWTHALIDHMGQVSVCCVLRGAPILGDLSEQTFSQIWSGPTYRALRLRGEQPLFEACRRCDDFLEENRALHHIAQLRSANTSPTSLSDSSTAAMAAKVARSASVNVRAS